VLLHRASGSTDRYRLVGYRVRLQNVRSPVRVCAGVSECVLAWGKGARHGTVSVRFGAGRGWRACASFAAMGAASIESTIDACFSVAFVAVSCSRISGLSAPGRVVSQAARAACVRACARGTGRLRRADHGRATCRRAGLAGIARGPAGRGPALRHSCVVLSKKVVSLWHSYCPGGCSLLPSCGHNTTC